MPIEPRPDNEPRADDGSGGPPARPEEHDQPRSRIRVLPVLATVVVVAAASLLGWLAWDRYMGAPWTRDGTVRAYIVSIAPEVAGRIVELPVADNQFVHKGDLLIGIDTTDYKIAVEMAEAAVKEAEAKAKNTARESERRRKLSAVAVTEEEQQTFATAALAAQAALQQAKANLDRTRVNLERCQIRSPVNGWVTNLLARIGDYATIGQKKIVLLDADSFWIDAYFEETRLGDIRVGDTAIIKLMGHDGIVRGHVDSVARGVNVPNAQPDQAGLASVNPIFTWVRLAKRVPVRIHIDEVPAGVNLVVGTTASVQIERPAK
jgi:multidrug resistance efflux pump